MNITNPNSEDQSTIQIISTLFSHIDTISLPIFMIIFVIIQIYKVVKDNIHFNKKFKLKEESIKVSNAITNNVLQETISSHNATELIKSKINETNNQLSNMTKQSLNIKPVLTTENCPNSTQSIPLVIDIAPATKV